MVMILFAIVFSLPASAEEADIFSLVEVGLTKDEIIKILNEPYEKNTFIKTNRPIWGPEEEFWDKIPGGTKLEVWKYKSKRGHLNLYFLDNDDRLSYKAFAPAGIVYEPTR